MYITLILYTLIFSVVRDLQIFFFIVSNLVMYCGGENNHFVNTTFFRFLKLASLKLKVSKMPVLIYLFIHSGFKKKHYSIMYKRLRKTIRPRITKKEEYVEMHNKQQPMNRPKGYISLYLQVRAHPPIRFAEWSGDKKPILHG